MSKKCRCENRVFRSALILMGDEKLVGPFLQEQECTGSVLHTWYLSSQAKKKDKTRRAETENWDESPNHKVTITQKKMVTELIRTESNDEQSQHVQEASVLIFFIIPMKHNQVVWRETNSVVSRYFYWEEDEWQKEHVTNRTEMKVTEECAARARSHVRGLWPVSHIIEQSVRHSSSAVPVALSPVKNYQKNPVYYHLLSLFSCCHFRLPPLSHSLFALFFLSDPSLVTVSHYSFIMMHCTSVAANYFNASSSLTSAFCSSNT